MKTIAYLAAAACLFLTFSGITLRAVAAPCAVHGRTVKETTPARQITLRLKFKVGRTETYHLVVSSIGTVSRDGGAALPINQAIDATISQAVQSIDPLTGAATIKSHLDSGTMTLTINGKPVPGNQQAGLQALGNITSVVEPNGKVDSLHMAAPSSPQSPFNFSSNSSMFGAIFSTGKAVSVGDSWSRNTKDGPMGMNYGSTYTLSGLATSNGDQLATVDCGLSGTLSTRITTPVMATIDGQFSGSQKTIFDNTEGISTAVTGSSHLVMNTTATIPKTAQAGAAGGTTHHAVVDMNQTISMKLLIIN